MKDVVIIGVGMTKFGELWDKSLQDLFVEAALAAMEDAGVLEVDSMVVGSMSPGLFNQQEHIASLMADALGNRHIAATRVESACASGALALRTAYAQVASGLHEVVLAGGVEKMTDISGGMATKVLATAADGEYEGFHGVTFPGLYAMMANLYLHTYGYQRDILTAVAVKNHANGALNPKAQYPFPVKPEQVENATMVAYPLRLLDCSPITDGAAACIVTTREKAEKMAKKVPIRITGTGAATDTLAYYPRQDLLWLTATEKAAERALRMANCSIHEVDFAEVHDCFTIAEILILEALKKVEKGKGGQAVLDGLTKRDGDFPVNPSGGLKSKGHPVGATGIAQVCEAVWQLRREAGKRQLSRANRALTQNMGGSGGSAIVHILEVLS